MKVVSVILMVTFVVTSSKNILKNFLSVSQKNEEFDLVIDITNMHILNL